MTARSTLFRAEAMEARQRPWLGAIVMASPPSFAVWTAGAVAMALAVVLLFGWGSYARRITVAGRLTPSTGLVKVHAPLAAVVLRRLVDEGDAVHQGQPLFELGSHMQDTQASVSDRVRERGQLLQAQQAQTLLLQHQEQQTLQARLVLLGLQQQQLDAQIASQQERAALARDVVERQRALLEQGFVSREMLQARQADALDQQVRLQGLEREREAVQLERGTRANELKELGFRQQVQQAELERSRSSAAQELLESESRRSLVVVAPQAGKVTSIVAEAGQAVDPSRALLSLVPAGSELQAHLYAPSRAIGFVKIGDAVRLRYAAYPYQKFGQADAVVTSIARTALSAAELGGSAEAPAGDGEPLYRITAALASQHMAAYGREWPLHVSMGLDADLLQERRRLYEWVLEPLYGLSRKLAP